MRKRPPYINPVPKDVELVEDNEGPLLRVQVKKGWVSVRLTPEQVSKLRASGRG